MESARAVPQLRGDAEAPSEMGRRAQEYVAGDYDRSRLIDRYVEALESASV